MKRGIYNRAATLSRKRYLQACARDRRASRRQYWAQIKRIQRDVLGIEPASLGEPCGQYLAMNIAEQPQQEYVAAINLEMTRSLREFDSSLRVFLERS